MGVPVNPTRQCMDLYNYLCQTLQKSKKEISWFAFSAPNKYKIYSIPKRTSGKRIIAHPSKELKAYQWALLEKFESTFKVHENAYAYQKGIGIKDNARRHKSSPYLLKLDFSNFFHSITPEMLHEAILSQEIGLLDDDKFLLAQLLFCRMGKKADGKLVLSIGAPTSPIVSNIVMRRFDSSVAHMCDALGIVYTRYADDLTFSTREKGILFDTPKVIKKFLQDEFAGRITLNDAKTVYSSKAHNRHVTGITITNDGKISVGRKRKKYVSSLIHKYSQGDLEKEDIFHLKGLLSFILDIEPEVLVRMKKKYSSDLINNLMKET
jgi:RNA-directed DNA polymerase